MTAGNDRLANEVLCSLFKKQFQPAALLSCYIGCHNKQNYSIPRYTLSNMAGKY